jgi:hypothetical protein
MKALLEMNNPAWRSIPGSSLPFDARPQHRIVKPFVAVGCLMITEPPMQPMQADGARTNLLKNLLFCLRSSVFISGQYCFSFLR